MGLRSQRQRAGSPIEAMGRACRAPTGQRAPAYIARGTPKTRGRLRLAAKRAQQAGRLNVARWRLSPCESKSLPFWQFPSWSLAPGPGSRRSRRARKSHFCRNTYVNGRAQKERVF
jgi:hypothetical protein